MDELATMTEAARQDVMFRGSQDPDRAWINSPYDTWLPNPYYRGPAVPHPEADPDD